MRGVPPRSADDPVAPRPVLVLVAGGVIACALGGCAGARIEGHVYHSPKGYRLTLPGPPWAVVEDGRADLELIDRAARAGILANASCDAAATPRLDILARHLLIGFRERRTIERGEVAVGSRRAAHTLLEGRLDAREPAVRVETYVLKDDRCVYDFAYVAPPAAFETSRAPFRRLVESLARESGDRE